METIGKHNKIIKEIRLLSSGKDHSSGKFIVEGERVIRELAQSSISVDYLFLAQSFKDDHAEDILEQFSTKSLIKVYKIDDELLRSLSAVNSNQGLLAVASIPKFNPDDINRIDRILVLSEIQDPGNIGTLIRSALAFGFQAVLIYAGAHPYNAKVVRSSAGAVFHLPCFYCTDKDIEMWVMNFQKNNFTFITAEAHGGIELEKLSLPKRIALVLGAEVKGINKLWQLQSIGTTVKLNPQSESLNVAIAGSIIMYKISTKDFR